MPMTPKHRGGSVWSTTVPVVTQALGRRGGTVLQLLIGLMPNCSVKRLLMRRLLGWDVASSAHVGPCVFLNVSHVALAPDSTIAGGTAFHRLLDLSLEEGAVMGYWNWVGSAPSLRTEVLDAQAPGRAARLRMGRESAITSRHYVDCSGGVEVGDFSLLAGVRSTVLSHQVDTRRSQQTVRPVVIGSYCFVGSNVKVVPGSTIPDRCVVAMGAVVTGQLDQTDSLYAGVPARRVKDADNAAYVERRTGYVDIP